MPFNAAGDPFHDVRDTASRQTRYELRLLRVRSLLWEKHTTYACITCAITYDDCVCRRIRLFGLDCLYIRCLHELKSDRVNKGSATLRSLLVAGPCERSLARASKRVSADGDGGRRTNGGETLACSLSSLASVL